MPVKALVRRADQVRLARARSSRQAELFCVLFGEGSFKPEKCKESVFEAQIL